MLWVYSTLPAELALRLIELGDMLHQQGGGRGGVGGEGGLLADTLYQYCWGN